jgi:uncharacterized membrane protein
MELLDVIVTLLVLFGLFIIFYMQFTKKHSMKEVLEDFKEAMDVLKEKPKEMKEGLGEIRLGEIKRWRK